MSERAPFTETLRLMVPQDLRDALNNAAADNLMTTSEYVRRCCVEKLRRDKRKEREAAV